MDLAVAVEHSLLRPGLEEREYQINIARSCLQRSTLVVVPTGLGKTVVALLVMAEVLRRQGPKVLLLAPTKPLVEQHAAFLREYLRADVAAFTGEVEPVEREAEWIEKSVIVSTPQVVENDLRQGRIGLGGLHLVVFDEAHRAVGDYSYVSLGKALQEMGGCTVMGMTASPGSDPERILEVCANLGIQGVEIRTEFDADVVRYIHDIYVEGARVDLPEVAKRMAGLLRGSFDDIIADLKARGFLTYKPMVNIRDLLATQADISRRLRSQERNGALYYAATQVALCLKINHALVLVETQGIGALRNYFAKLEEEGNKPDAGRASRNLLKIPKVTEAMKIARVVQPNDPKVAKAIEVVTQQLADKPEARTIVFAQFRDTAETLVRELGRVPGLRPIRFVGQATRGKDVGLSQREQAEIIEGFRSGKHNILVSSSVGEEGLDIPQVDLVVFYEPVPSEIRTIQRRGRTGRARPGRVVVLLSRDTRDEAYLASAKRKERRMHLELDRLRKQLKQRIFVGEVGGRAFVAPAEAGEAGYKSLEAALAEVETPPPPMSKRKGQASLGDYERRP